MLSLLIAVKAMAFLRTSINPKTTIAGSGMYTPEKFKLSDPIALMEAIERWNFGLLISNQGGQIETSLLPFMLDRENNRLLAHMAKANPHWKSLESTPECVISFQGPHCYISPSWYVTPNLIPTWNYVNIEVRGKAKLFGDQNSSRDVISQLVAIHEKHQPTPWTVSRVAPDMLDSMFTQIVTFEIAITTINGKEKLSQNRPLADRQSAIEMLSQSSDPSDKAVGELMQ